MFYIKLEIANLLYEREEKSAKIKFVLCENNELLKELNNYIPNLFSYLWENQQIMSILLLNSNICEIQTNLAPFIINNFYDNVLSNNSIENNLIYLLSLMLKEEISHLNHIYDDDLFLKETPCGYLLSELRKKNDIQDFFKNILLKFIEDLENSSYRAFNLDVENIIDSYKNNISEKEKEDKIKDKKPIKLKDIYRKPTNYDMSLNIDENQRKKITEEVSNKMELFTSNYLPNLTKDVLNEIINSDLEEDKKLKDYIKNIFFKWKGDENYFSNQKLISTFYKVKDSSNALYFYQKDFLKIIYFLDKLLVNLKDNLYLIPNSLKYICKTISILLEKKFNNINKVQINSFIAKFIFGKLLFPVLSNPRIELLIHNFIISKYTSNNIQIINKVFYQLVSFNFFDDMKDYNFTPFNWYFLKKIPEVLDIFDVLTNISLPKFLDNFLNDKLDENFTYDFFKDNPDEIFFSRTICFNLNNLISILGNIDKNREKIFIKSDQKGIFFKKTFEKLYSNKNRQIINELKYKEEDKTIKKKEK